MAKARNLSRVSVRGFIPYFQNLGMEAQIEIPNSQTCVGVEGTSRRSSSQCSLGLSRMSSRESVCLSRMGSREGFETGVDGEGRVSSFSFSCILIFFLWQGESKEPTTKQALRVQQERE